MSTSHEHNHDHGHTHGVAPNADKRYLTIALLLLLGFMAIEVVVGVMARSLALISDAGHMLTDVGAIGLALIAMRLASRPAQGGYTYGWKRAEILSAQANGLTLVILGLWFAVEAVRRLIEPPTVDGRLVTLVAIVGIAVNLLAVWVMRKANRQSLNVEGSFQHILTDLYAFIATAIAGVVVWWTGWNRVDAMAALVVAGLMLKAGVGLVRASGRVFMQAAPKGLDPDEVRKAMCEVLYVLRVEDLHVWELTSGMPALSAQLYIDSSADDHAVRRQVKAVLHDQFAIAHTTLQTDRTVSKEDSDAATTCAFDASSR